MKAKISILLAGAAIFLAAGLAAAQHSGQFGKGEHGFGDPERMVEHLARQLELDDDQSQVLKNIIGAALPEITELKDAARENRQAIAALDVEDPDYAARLDNLAAENGRLAAAATRLHGRLRAEISAALTPEQRSLMTEKMAGMRAHFGQRRHRDHQQEREL